MVKCDSVDERMQVYHYKEDYEFHDFKIIIFDWTSSIRAHACFSKFLIYMYNKFGSEYAWDYLTMDF